MHIFLIRHGETEHNIAGLLAGVTDSRLTNHGALQTQQLGANLVKDRGLRFTNIYSSNLQRAFLTANEICKVQNKLGAAGQTLEVVKLEILQEQDFGSLELVSWTSRNAENSRVPKPTDGDFKPKETTHSMKSRADIFLNDYIVPLFALEQEQPNRIAIVSHGIFLAHLWRALLARFDTGKVTISPSIATSTYTRPFEHMSWSNTGCLEVEIRLSNEIPQSVKESESSLAEDVNGGPFTHASMVVKAINDKRHLQRLKRARGGIGSATYDQRQQNLNSFFKKRKFDSKPQEDSKS